MNQPLYKSISNNTDKQMGHSLIALMIYMGLSCTILASLIQHLHMVCVTYKQQNLSSDQQNSQILTMHHLTQDIHNAGFRYCHLDDQRMHFNHIPAASSCNVNDQMCKYLLPVYIQQRIAAQDIKPHSDILILNAMPVNFTVNADNSISCSTTTLLYYLRKSIIDKHNNYTLYRDDLIHHSVAVSEGFADLHITISRLKQYLSIKIVLSMPSKPELQFVLTTRNEQLSP